MTIKIRATSVCLLLTLMYSTALAQSDVVNRFLNRYRSPRPQSATAPVSAGPVSLASLAQNGIVSLTTLEVVRLLLENNRDVSVDRLAPLSSFYTIDSLYRPFEPNFHVFADVNHLTSPSANVLAGAASLIRLSHDYRVGVDQTLQTGTFYSIDFNFLRTSTNSVFEVFNPAYNGLIRYQVTQHLLRDFGRQVNSHLIRIARNNEKISEGEFELQVIDLVTQALQSYWDLVFSAEDLKVKKRSLDLAQRTHDENLIQVQIGTLAPIDLVQAEAEVATRYEDFITAQYNIDLLQDQMKKLISDETDPGLVLTQLNLIEPVRQPSVDTRLPLSQAIQFALENRREMKQADYDIENQEINIQFTKNQMRPIFDVTAGYSHSGLGGTQTIRNGFGQGSEIVEVIPGGIGDMFRQLYQYNFPGYNLGFNLVIPLQNKAAKADYYQALNEREISTKKKGATAQQIAIEVRNAYTEVDKNRARVQTARTARELSVRRLDAEQAKFELGTSTTRFVLEEQRNLAQAETNEIEALVNYTKSLVLYERAIGATLSRNNVELNKQLPKLVTSRN